MRRFVLALVLTVATPAAAQRELTTDRPDKTEAPQTVASGHFQVELDLVSLTRDRAGDERSETWAVTPFNLKYGVSRDTDVQLIVSPYLRQVVGRGGARQVTQGFGDVTVRVKHNLWGDDGGKTALAVLPFVTLPTAEGGLGAQGVEGGVILPLSVELAEGIKLGAMTEADAVRDDGHYHASLINSATLGVELTKKLGMYAELFTERDRDWIVTGDTGVTYKLGEDAQLDAGVNLGLSRAADDVALFVGYSRRF